MAMIVYAVGNGANGGGRRVFPLVSVKTELGIRLTILYVEMYDKLGEMQSLL